MWDGLYNMCGMLSGEEELTAFLSLLDFFVGVDSGPLHIAGALGVPGYGVFPMYSSDIRLKYYPTLEGIDVPEAYHSKPRDSFYPEDVDEVQRAQEQIDWDYWLGKILERLEA